MPRLPRIEWEGGLYHVMCRGDRREAIYKDDKEGNSQAETKRPKEAGLSLVGKVQDGSRRQMVTGGLVDGQSK